MSRYPFHSRILLSRVHLVGVLVVPHGFTLVWLPPRCPEPKAHRRPAIRGDRSSWLEPVQGHLDGAGLALCHRGARWHGASNESPAVSQPSNTSPSDNSERPIPGKITGGVCPYFVRRPLPRTVREIAPALLPRTQFGIELRDPQLQVEGREVDDTAQLRPCTAPGRPSEGAVPKEMFHGLFPSATETRAVMTLPEPGLAPGDHVARRHRPGRLL